MDALELPRNAGAVGQASRGVVAPVTLRKCPPNRRLRSRKVAACFWPGTQTSENVAGSMQLRALRDYAGKRGWTVVSQVKEVGSGVAQREQRQQLIHAARRREIDVGTLGC